MHPLIGLLNGEGSVFDSRDALEFTCISPGNYTQKSDSNVFILKEIKALNEPYLASGDEVKWIETKQYENHEETRLGLSKIMQITYTKTGQMEPYKIVLPAVDNIHYDYGTAT